MVKLVCRVRLRTKTTHRKHPAIYFSAPCDARISLVKATDINLGPGKKQLVIFATRLYAMCGRFSFGFRWHPRKNPQRRIAMLAVFRNRLDLIFGKPGGKSVMLMRAIN